MRLLLIQQLQLIISEPSDLSGEIQIGSKSDSITITITNDDENEGNESFKVKLKSLTGAVFAGGATEIETTVTIEDDEDPELSFKTTEFNPAEDIQRGMFEVVVELSGATDSLVSFDIALSDGTATKNSDYENPASLRGMIPVGSTEATIMIPITTDLLHEGNETFNLTISNIMGAEVAGTEVTLVQEITIVDDETPTLQFTNNTFSVAENGTEVEITVELTGATGTNVNLYL